MKIAMLCILIRNKSFQIPVSSFTEFDSELHTALAWEGRWYKVQTRRQAHFYTKRIEYCILDLQIKVLPIFIFKICLDLGNLFVILGNHISSSLE